MKVLRDINTHEKGSNRSKHERILNPELTFRFHYNLLAIDANNILSYEHD